LVFVRKKLIKKRSGKERAPILPDVFVVIYNSGFFVVAHLVQARLNVGNIAGTAPPNSRLAPTPAIRSVRQH
jgi:hypothetical protein